MSLAGLVFGWRVLIFVLPATLLQAQTGCFQEQYMMDESFVEGFSFANVSDIAVNIEQHQVFVLQRSYPAVTVWNTDGMFLFAWSTKDIGYPHSIKLNGSDPEGATVWVTDMGDHCVKEFTYYGQYINSIGECGRFTNGSGLNPPQFGKVTDIAFNSKGYYYVTDGDIGGINNRVLVFDDRICLVDVWNKGNKAGSAPLQFNLPHSVIIDRCDRVWIVDTQNYRIQVINSNGTFIGQWNCFGKSLIYGIDFRYGEKSNFVILTTITNDGNQEILFIPFNQNCVQLYNIGSCTIKRRLTPKHNSQRRAKMGQLVSIPMLHSVAFDSDENALYFAELPGPIPPMKFHLLPAPPASNISSCAGMTKPPPWQIQWSATALFTPFDASDLQTGKVEYNAKLRAMYFALHSPNSIIEYLNVENSTFILQNTSCLGPYKFNWVTPPREWLSSHKCECKGSLNISGVQVKAWRCPMYGVVHWYWFHEGDNNTWRMLFDNKTNPNHLPVLGDFAMVHFSDYGVGTETLEAAYSLCTKGISSHSVQLGTQPLLKGFSYTRCSEMKHLPSWPQDFYMTVTMLPVLPGLENPLPTSVVYDWQRQSQRTIMCKHSQSYNAYLIVNNTYILNRELGNGTIQCLSDLKFGPVSPNWMAKDNCKCMGTVTDNLDLSPWHFTAMVTCPLIGDRVFWAWFTNNTGYTPLLFVETLTPPEEGTGLALADYHNFYSKDILIDLHEFSVPSQCLHSKNNRH